MPNVIWSSPGNPPRSVARALGIDEYNFGDALHRIKRDAGLSPSARVEIWSKADVTEYNDPGDVPIGNIRDEI